MSFLYPSFLWAMTALAIPVIVHLFHFRKTKRVYFSNTRLLQEVKSTTAAKRRLKHYLILASRLLFLFFLVLVFAQPIIPSQEQSQTRNIALYIDNSQSLSAFTADNVRALDASLEWARLVVELFPPDTRYLLVTNDFAPSSNSYKTKSETLDLLGNIRFSSIARTFQEVYDRIKRASGEQYEVFWISDFQQSTFGPIGQLDSSVRLHLVRAPLMEPSNIYVDTAFLENPHAVGGEKNVLKVMLRNDGKKNVNQMVVKLTTNGLQSGTSSVNIPAGGMGEASFDIVAGLSRLNRLKIGLSDFPISFDNEFYLALNFNEKIVVTEIKGDAAPTPIEKVFGNASVFNFRTFMGDNVNYSVLSNTDFVVINGLKSIDPSLGTALRAYLEEGHSLLFIPAPGGDVENYRNFLHIPQLNMGNGKETMALEAPDFSNPFFEHVFEEKAQDMGMPSAIAHMSWGMDRSAILKFKNGSPFLSVVEGKGKLFLLASPLKSGFSDFYNHALFVPVMYRMASGGRKETMKPYHFLRDNFIAINVDSIGGDVPLRLIGEEEVVPSQRKLGNQVFLELPRFSMSQGFYHVVYKKDSVNLLALNLEQEESQLAQWGGEELKTRLGGGKNITLFEASTPDAFSNEIKERYLGKPLWKYALALALFFLMVEVLFIRFLK